MASVIMVNGQTVLLPDGARNVSIRDNRVWVNGVELGAGSQPTGSVIEVRVVGNPLSVESDQSVNVSGSVGGDVRARGSVSCGRVAGRVDAGGSVNCDDVGGDVSAGGSVNCDDVKGSVRAGGSVRHG